MKRSLVMIAAMTVFGAVLGYLSNVTGYNAWRVGYTEHLSAVWIGAVFAVLGFAYGFLIANRAFWGRIIVGAILGLFGLAFGWLTIATGYSHWDAQWWVNQSPMVCALTFGGIFAVVAVLMAIFKR